MSRESDIKLKLGFVGVRCRSPAEIKSGVTFAQMAENEKKHFQTSSVFTGTTAKSTLLIVFDLILLTFVKLKFKLSNS